MSKQWAKLNHWLLQLRSSLRARVALGVALPVLVAMIALSLFHYWREYQLIEDQVRLSAVRLGDMMIRSLNHAMLFKDGEHLITTLDDVEKLENVEQIQIIGLSGEVLSGSGGDYAGTFSDLSADECQECHRFPAESRPRIAQIEGGSPFLRIAAPINNTPECYECHEQSISHLGVLLIDMSIVGEQSKLIRDLQIDLLVSILITVLITVGIYYLVHRLVVRRIELLREPLVKYAAGDLSVRVPRTSQIDDEICELGDTFNRMADEIERHVREQEERSHVREQAIIDERERIARELHDGMAQVLGYVNTKAMAVRLMLQKGKLQDADRQLGQLEEAARSLFVDVREAILGLKMTGEVGSNLPSALNSYVEQYTRLSDIPVKVNIQPQIRDLKLPTDTELQLLRIIQEGLSNIRKHASASRVLINLQVKDDILKLQIRDDGRGFDPSAVAVDGRPDHYGLDSMRERAESIGASFMLDSQVGIGTEILVQLGLDGR
ncbi:histidine kinase [Chloroflexota bacterium]